MRRAAAALVGALALGAAVTPATGGGDTACAPRTPSPDVARNVRAALAARTDVLGNRLLRAAAGPTWEGAVPLLPPLLLARADHGSTLTDSGVHYLPFGRPTGPQGSGSVPLHVADGSQVVSQRRAGATLTAYVGTDGRERYGSCLARLSPPTLAGGFLPILRTAYVDAAGNHYRQESFAAPLPDGGDLASFVRLTVDTRGSRDGATPRLVSSGDRALTLRVAPGGGRTLYVAWPNRSLPGRLREIDRGTYDAARRSVQSFWRERLAAGAGIVVPERRVTDAIRALLWQNLVLGWRYSVGNHYQQLATADGLAAAGVMGRYGFGDVERAVIEFALSPRRLQTPYRNWKLGAKLQAVGLHDALFHDDALVDEVTPTLERYVEELAAQIDGDRGGLLRRERFSSDVREPVYGLHAQSAVWSGLLAMGRAWARTGHSALAAECRRLATRLGAALRRALRASETRLPDGSLFVPMRLLDDERPYDALTASRAGSYWNLVAPYALATGIVPPRSGRSQDAVDYLLRHGSRLLGLVRAGAYALGGDATGTDQVYGLGVSRVLADDDRPDQLVLTLYGQLAAGMTHGTFVSGEAASLEPVPGTGVRAMYLPPNGTSNAAFLETLRLMLVHETTGSDGRSRGLELAFATPRTWLAPGRRLGVRELPTSFGPVSFSLARARGVIRASFDLPRSAALRTVDVRLRLPDGARVTRVSTGTLLRDGETVRLDRHSGHVELVVSAQPS